MKQVRAVVLLVCVLALSAFTDSHANQSLTDPRIAVQWNDIRAESFEEFVQKLNEHGPQDQFGVTRYAVTRWTIRWNWPVENAIPNFSKVVVHPEVRLELPRWIPTNSISSDETVSWNRFFQALLVHEFGHVRRAFTTAEKIERGILNRSHDKNFTSRDAHVLARRLIRDNNDWDLEYDRVTGHGVHQGVSLDCVPAATASFK